MDIALISIFPDYFDALEQFGITSGAIKKKCCQLHFFNPRDYTTDRYQSVDDRPYGGGPGMVMRPEPLSKAILAAKAKLGADASVIYLDPKGSTLQQSHIENYAQSQKPLILLCGRYEGIDQLSIRL